MTDRRNKICEQPGAAPLRFSRVRVFARQAQSRERHHGKSHLHFIPLSCRRRRPLLRAPETRGHFVQFLDEVRARYRFRPIGYVVMPKHIHLLVSEPPTGNLSTAVQVLKQRVSASLPLRKRNFEYADGSHLNPVN